MNPVADCTMAERVEKCTADPNFAVICSFLERFAKPCGISHPNFLELQEMLENCEIVPQPLVDLHVKLLRKARKSVSIERWERAVVKFCHMYAGSEFQQDGWEMERLGYKNLRLDGKLRVLKLLLEHQFDLNTKFKAEVNRLSSSELRLQPFGRDKVGQNYWLQQDEFCNLKVYREDADNETWQVVASDRESLVQLIGQLSGGNLDAVFNSDDSNSQEVSEGLDTGQAKEDKSSSKLDKHKSDDNIANGGVTETGTKLETKADNPAEVEDKSIVKLEGQDGESETTSDNNAEVAPLAEQTTKEEVKDMLKENVHKTDETEKAHDKRPAEAPSEERDAKRVKVEGVEVSEAIEEPTLIVAGEGSGKESNDGNNILSNFDSFEVGEAIEEPVMYFCGDGSGHECHMGNPTNSDETEKSGTTSGDAAKVISKANEGESLPSTNGSIEAEPKKNDDDELDFLKTGFYFGPGTLAAKDRIPMGSPEPKVSTNQEPGAVEGEPPSEAAVDGGNNSNLINPTEKISTSPDVTNEELKAVSTVEVSCLENVNVSSESGTKGTEPVKESEKVPSAGCLDAQDNLDPSVSTSQLKDSCTPNDVESLNVSEVSTPPDSEPEKLLCSTTEIKPDASVTGSNTEIHSETSASACVNADKVEATDVISRIEDIEPVTSQTSSSLLIPPLKVTTNAEISDQREAGDKNISVPTADTSAKATDDPTSPGNKPLVEESQPIVEEDSPAQLKSQPSIENSESDSHQSILGQEIKASDQTDNEGASKMMSSEETAVLTVDSEVCPVSLDVKPEIIRPDGSDLVNAIDNVPDSKANASADVAGLPPAVTMPHEDDVPASACSDVNESKEMPVTSVTEEKMLVPEDENKEISDQDGPLKVSEDIVLESRDDMKKEEIHLESKSQSLPTAATSVEAECSPPVEPPVISSAVAESQSVLAPVTTPSVAEPQQLPVFTLSDTKPALAADSPVSAVTDSKLEDVPTAAIVGEELSGLHEDHPSVLDDDPPAITTLEDAMRQMEAAGAPVNLDDSDDDDHADVAGDAHEEEEEEKSFFVFEGSTGGWKHATTGQMEDEENDKELYPELEQTAEEPEASDSNSSKKTTSSSLKERLKIIPRRGTRSTRQSDPIEDAGKDEVVDKDPLAVSGDESVDQSSSRGKKRRSNDGDEGSDNADKEDDTKRSRMRGKHFGNRTSAEERRTGLGDGSSGDEGEAEAEPEDGEPEQGDAEEGSAAQAPRRGGWRGRRGRGRWRGRGRGRGGRGAASSTGHDKVEAESGDVADKSDTSSVPPTPEKSPRKPKKSRMLAELEVDLDAAKVDEPEETGRAVRTSRRIAQIRLKEQAEKRDYEEAELTLKERLKMEKDAKKAAKLEKKRLAQEKAAALGSDSEDDRKKKKKKKERKEKKPNFNPDKNVWNQTSSGSSSGSESVEEEIPEPSDDDAPFVVKSDHEFSPESDVNDDDYEPTRRARTARRDKGVEAEVEPEPQDYPCKKCAKSDQPEWMLLCDKCDAGWHCSCLRPALLQIPEGDWFCPPCQHTLLIASLQEHLQSYDENVKRLASEEARKQFMSFVEVNAENILPDEEGEIVKKKKKKKKYKIKHRERVRGKRRRCQIIDSDKEDDGESGSDGSEDDLDNDDKNDPDAEDESEGSSASAETTSSGTPTSSSSSSSSSSASEKSSDEDEPIYQLRQRRQTNVNYRFSEYDDLIKSAIQDGIEEEAKAAETATTDAAPVEGVQPGIPEKTVKSVGKVLEGEEEEQEESSDEDVKKKPQRRGKYLTDEEEEDEPEAKEENDDEEDEEDEEEDGYVPPVVKSSAKSAKAKKKKRSLTALEFTSSSSDPESDEDFNGSSALDDEEEEAESLGSDSDDSVVLSRRKGGPVRRSGRYSNRMTKWDREFIDDSSSMDSDDSDAPRKKKKKKSAPKPRRAPPKRAAPKGRPKKKARRSDDSDKEVKIKKAKPKAAPKREQSGSDSDAPAPRRTRGRKINYQEALASSDDEGSGDKKADKKGKGKFADLAKGKKPVESPDSADAVTTSKEKPRTHPRVKVTPLRNAPGNAGAATTAASDVPVGVPTATIVSPAGVPLAASAAVSITPSVVGEKASAPLQPSVTITPSTKKNPSVPAPPAQMKTPSHIVAPGIPPSITAVPINPETKAPVGVGQSPRSLKELQQLVGKTPEASVSPVPQGAPGVAGAAAAAGTPLAPHATAQASPMPAMPAMPSGPGAAPAPTSSYPSASGASGPLMAMQALAGEAPPPAYPYAQQYYHQPPPHAPYLPTPHHTSHLTQPTASPHLQSMAPHHGAHLPHHPHLGPPGPPGPPQHHQSASHHQPPHHPTPTHHAPASHHASATHHHHAAAPPPHHLIQGHHLSPHHPHLAVPPHHQPHPMLPHLPYGPPPPGAPHALQALAQLPPQVPSPGTQPPPKYEEERRSEFGGLVSYFSSQHDDMEG